jgi:phage terminase large subunit-like protein
VAKRLTRRRSTSTAADGATAYARDVLSGAIVAGPHVRNACRRHLDDIANGPARGLKWDVAAATWAIQFFPDCLRLAQGKFAGRKFTLEPSQQFIIGSIFGWKGPDGARRFRRAYIEQGKGNGKSPLAAGIGMYCLIADKEAQAEVYAGASMKSQAMVIFRAAVQMWRQSPALSEILTPSGGNPIWNLAHLRSGSFFRPISTDEAHSGPMPSCALLDEIHEHRDGNMLEMMERGFKSRRQPLLIMITNSGSDRNSVCWQEHQHAVRVAAGTLTPDDAATYVGEAVDDSAFSYVSAVDQGDDPLNDEACWIKTNPLLGVTMPAEELRRAVRQAKQIPGKLNNVLRLHLCTWTDSDVAWMARAALEAVLADFDPEREHADAELFVGVDLSATQDITAMAFVVPTGMRDVRREDGIMHRLPTFDAWVEAWTPRDSLDERALRDEAPYDVWARDGWLVATPGKVIRFDYLAARVAELGAAFDLKALAFDAYAFRKNFEPELDAAGVTVPLLEHPQGGRRKAADSGLWMPGSLKELEALILEGRIRIRRSPVIISAAMSAVTETDAFDNRWFSKRKATNRIDAIVALAMAIGAATQQDQEASIDDFLNAPVIA